MGSSGIRAGVTAVVLSLSLAACGGGAPEGEGWQALDDERPAPGWPQGQALQADQGLLANAPEGQMLQRQAAPPPMPPPPETSRLQPAQIVDHKGFGQPMVAANLQVPVGWQVVGGVGWNDATPCVGNQLQMGWSAIAPDSLTAIEKLPGFAWQVQGTEQQFNPCPSAPFRNARQFLEATASRLRPGSQLVGYEDLTQDVMQQLQASGSAVQGRWDAGRIRIAYRDQGGVQMEEVLTAAVSFTENAGSLVGGTAVVDAHRAPAGRLDMDLIQRVAATVRLDPQWAQAMQQRQRQAVASYHGRITSSINDWHNRQMAAINARGAADRHAIRMRTNQEVAGIYGAIAANSSATSDRMHATTMSGIQEVNNFSGVDGGTVQNSIHNGQRVFQNTANPNEAYSTDAPYHTPPSGYAELQQQ